MTALRIRGLGDSPAPPTDDPLKAYLERLVKLIPAEVVGLYLAGRSLLQTAFGLDPLKPGHADFAAQRLYWLGWTLFCFAAVLLVRAWATSDPSARIKPQWPAVGIAAASFLVWVYSFGDVFRLYGTMWRELGAGLIVLAWTFIVPFLYRGPSATP